MKQLKDIFGRKTSIWLAIELVLVTCACWWAFDPVIITSYVTHLPMNCDIDRIVKMEIASSLTDNERAMAGISFYDGPRRLMQKVQEMDEVEVGCLSYDENVIGFGESYLIDSYYHEGDTILCHYLGFEKDSKIFEAYGIQSLTPEVPTAELTHGCEKNNTIIITRSVAMAFFGTIDVAGKIIHSDDMGINPENGQWEPTRRDWQIRAVVEDFRREVYDRDYANVFVLSPGARARANIIVRLRDGIDARRFVQEQERNVQHNIVTEHNYIRKMQTAREASELDLNSSWMGKQTRRNLLIAAFFAINLAFGVFGTLLMYTRQRREEAGVRRAFGATKWSVFWGFIREAWLLTTLSVVAGCAIYFQYATAHGLYSDFGSLNPAVHFWFDDFGTHFLVVSAIVYLIILCAVLIATAIPALRICRSEITEVLKDE